MKTPKIFEKEYITETKWITVNLLTFILFINYDWVATKVFDGNSQMQLLLALSLIGTSIGLYKKSLLWLFAAEVGSVILFLILLVILMRGSGNIFCVGLLLLTINNIQILIPHFKIDPYKENIW